MDIARLTGVLAFPFFVGIAVVAEPVLRLFFGEEWLGAAPVLSVMAFLGLYFSIAMVQQSFCLAAGKAGEITILTWANVALGAVLMLIAVALGAGGDHGRLRCRALPALGLSLPAGGAAG